MDTKWTLKWKRQPAARQDAGDQGGRDHGHGGERGHGGLAVHLRLRDPLGLGAPVLEPDLDLQGSQINFNANIM